ncbi:hypothetical protein LRE75_30850 [Streptomyces sp. 372A]
MSIRHTDRLADIGAFASVGSGAGSYGNAMAEALGAFWRSKEQTPQPA